jgi:hypothetical protein
MRRAYKIFDWSKRFPNSVFRWAVVTQGPVGTYAEIVCQRKVIAKKLCAVLNNKEEKSTSLNYAKP